jgi:hypothetical protein
VAKGVNDLQTTDPEIAAMWDYEKNYPITPSQIRRGSVKKYWWIDSKGVSFSSTPYHLTSKKTSMSSYVWRPQNGRVAGANVDLASDNPELAAQWNYKRNGDLLPTQVSKSSSKKVWWICDKGHEWQATISNRNSSSNKTKCPICCNQKTVTGINDLATLYPNVVLDWDYEKNELDPHKISPGSNKRAFWKCHTCGYEWTSVICSRTHGGCGCPSCSHSRGSKLAHLKRKMFRHNQ